MKKLIRIACGLIVAYFAVAAMAQTASPSTQSVAAEAQSSPYKYTLMLSPYTRHFNPEPTHRPVFLVGIEREHPNAKLDGVVLFRNSFGQPSIYVYPFGGVYKSIFGIDKLSFKWTGGLIYGYKGEFKDEIANYKGIAPAIVPGLTYEFKDRWSAQVNLLGAAAVQIQLNVPLN
jgi:hypothetical protein